MEKKRVALAVRITAVTVTLLMIVLTVAFSLQLGAYLNSTSGTGFEAAIICFALFNVVLSIAAGIIIWLQASALMAKKTEEEVAPVLPTKNTAARVAAPTTVVPAAPVAQKKKI
jgi:hypothetical protein